MDLTPTTTAEVADILRDASQGRRLVMPVGGGTRSRRGLPRIADVTLSTRGLDSVVEHQPAELTATVGAGLLATDLAERLRAAGQWWPQADIRPGSTVGGILATAASGRGRLRHGPVRDSLLEVVLVTGDGRVVTAGGRTVKGVAGYDIPRLAVGSMGTLGVIAQVTLKLWPLPATTGWFSTTGSLEERIDAAESIRSTAWRPAAILLTPGTLSVQLIGSPDDVRAPAGLQPSDAPAEPEGSGMIDVGVPPRALGTVISAVDALGVEYRAEWGVGACRVALRHADDVATIRSVAVAAGGHAVVVDGDDQMRRDPWGEPPAGQHVMRRLRQSFDPAGILAPGRTIGDDV